MRFITMILHKRLWWSIWIICSYRFSNFFFFHHCRSVAIRIFNYIRTYFYLTFIKWRRRTNENIRCWIILWNFSYYIISSFISFMKSTLGIMLMSYWLNRIRNFIITSWFNMLIFNMLILSLIYYRLMISIN